MNFNFLLGRVQFIRRSSLLLPALLAAIVLAGCSPRHNFEYEAEEIRALPQTGLKIAVLPFSDNRKEIDSGSTAWAWIPGVPTSAKTVDRPQTAEDRLRAEYFFPDLVAYGLVLDLLKNSVGSTVHLAPEVFDDYDIVIDGSIESLAKTDRRLTYGLGPASFLLHMFGLPPGSKGIDFNATYRVRKAGGEQIFLKDYQTDWVSIQYTTDELKGEVHNPAMEGINSTIRESNTDFWEDVAPILTEAAKPETAKIRRRKYYAALDPELKQLDQARIALLNSGKSGTDRFKRIAQQIQLREKLLEKYREAEEKVIAKQQPYLLRTQEMRIAQVSQVRQQKLEIEYRQQQMEEQAASQQNRAIAGAFLAGVLPAVGAARQAGTWSSAESAMAAQDLASSFSALQPAAAPPPDLTPFAQQLDVSFEGLGSSGINPFAGLEGSSIRDIRTKFLRRYRQAITPLSRL